MTPKHTEWLIRMVLCMWWYVRFFDVHQLQWKCIFTL